MPRLDAFLKLGLAQGCSDVHLAVGVPPMLRMNGDLMPIKFRELSDTELENYMMEILSDNQKEYFYPVMIWIFPTSQTTAGGFASICFAKTRASARFSGIFPMKYRLSKNLMCHQSFANSAIIIREWYW